MPAIHKNLGHTVLDRETPPKPTREAAKPKSGTPQLSFPNSPDLNRLSQQKVNERHARAVEAWNREIDRDLALTRDALRAMGFSEAEIAAAERGQ